MSRDGEQAIRDRAYQIWEQEGRPNGRALEHWLRAKADIEAGPNDGVTNAGKIAKPGEVDVFDKELWPYLAAASVVTAFSPELLHPLGGGDVDLARAGEMLMVFGKPVSLGAQRGKWRLDDNTRRQVLKELAARGQIREALAANSAPPDDQTQCSLEELLLSRGRPSVPLSGRPLGELLGIQRAVDWLEGVPGVPPGSC